MNAWELLQPAFAIAGAIANAIGSLVAGQQVQIAPIRTYFGNLHLEIDIAIKTIPPP